MTIDQAHLPDDEGVAITATDTPTPPTEILGDVERAVIARSKGNIRDLRVVAREGAIVLLGRTNTYHTRQMATHAAIDQVEVDWTIKNEIEVTLD